MILKNCLEALDRTLQDIMLVDRTNEEGNFFGKKTVFLGGDFRQILLSIQYGTK